MEAFEGPDDGHELCGEDEDAYESILELPIGMIRSGLPLAGGQAHARSILCCCQLSVELIGS